MKGPTIMTTTTRTITAIIDTDLAVLWGAGKTRDEAERVARDYAASEGLDVAGWYAITVERDAVPAEMTTDLAAIIRARIESLTGMTGSRALDDLRRHATLALR